MRITALPAKRGDSLLIEYGDGVACGRILIDCGFKSAYTDAIRPALENLDGTKRFRLLVVTHVDLDHVNGVLAMFTDPSCPVSFDEVWFNTFEHLQGKRVVQPRLEQFGGPEGEELSQQLITKKVDWNRAFDGRAVTTTTPMEPIDEHLQVTVLSPTIEQLADLTPKWATECVNAGIKPGFQPAEPADVRSPFEEFGAPTVADVHQLAATRFEAEDSKSNGSTIALLLRHGRCRVLLTGDAANDQLVEAISPLARAAGGRLPLDLMQVPHHGSKGNLSKELLGLVDCQRFIVSTDGGSFGHPHDETIARILGFGGDHKKWLVFNYRARATRWRSQMLQQEFNYEIVIPSAGAVDGVVTVDLSDR